MVTPPSNKSGVEYADAATFVASLSNKTIEEQLALMKAQFKAMPTSQWRAFLDHPAVQAWIDRYLDDINASVRIPKSP